jgi:dUTP pyrophosphatase
MKIKTLNINAKLPTTSTIFSAGYDLASTEEVVIAPHERKLVKTGLMLEIPPGYYGRIAPRSGLALKHGIDVFAGVIDSDYRGEIGVILYNSDKEKSFHISTGDRIAQIIFEKCYHFDFENQDILSDTSRGEGGFGSTGK